MAAKFTYSRVTITGGNGFIGARLLWRLLEFGCECTVVMPEGDSVERLRGLSPTPCVRPFSSPAQMGETVAATRPEIVYHLGALISNRGTIEDLDASLEWNLLSTVGLYRALLGSNVRRLVQAGSCEEYGRGETPFREAAAPDPVSPYSASKAAIACYARMFHNCFGLPVVTLRPSVIYGPGQSPRMMIPEVIAALIERRPVDTTEGRQTRDFLYIDDFVDALLQAAGAPGVEGEIFNVGSGQHVTVRACIELIEQLTDTAGMVRYGGRCYSSREIWAYVPDISRARERLNWHPHTSLQEGLRLTIAGFRNQATETKHVD